jgi:hypothetical protein
VIHNVIRKPNITSSSPLLDVEEETLTFFNSSEESDISATEDDKSPQDCEKRIVSRRNKTTGRRLWSAVIAGVIASFVNSLNVR